MRPRTEAGQLHDANAGQRPAPHRTVVVHLRVRRHRATLAADSAYVALAVPITTLWVGSTLQRNGRVFLLDVFDGDEDLASAVDHLLVVGLYGADPGHVSIALKTTDLVVDAVSAVEALSVEVVTSSWCWACCTSRTSTC